MKKNILGLLVIVFCLVLVGCNKAKGKNTIVGKWALGSFVYTFNEDGTCTYDVSGKLMKCTYKTDGDKISIIYEGNTAPFETTYSIDGNKLNVKDSFDNDTIYTRK